MSEQKHTPEPWFLVNDNKIYRNPECDLYEYNGTYGKGIAGDKAICICDIGWYGEDEKGFPAQANAARIVECVNALAGIENPIEWVEKAKKVVPYDLASFLPKAVDETKAILNELKVSRLQAENERLKAEINDMLIPFKYLIAVLENGLINTHELIQKEVIQCKIKLESLQQTND